MDGARLQAQGSLRQGFPPHQEDLLEEKAHYLLPPREVGAPEGALPGWNPRGVHAEETVMIKTYIIDERTRVRVGYPDGSIEVDVDLPKPLNLIMKTATRRLSAQAVLNSIPAVRHAFDMVSSTPKSRRKTRST